VIVGAFLLTAVDRGQQAPAGSSDKPTVAPEANHPSAPNQPKQIQEQGAKPVNIDAAVVERRKQFSNDSAQLLKLANELKKEVDKTDKDTLSIAVIRKADEIEKLAHKVREKMKPTVAAN
jgi:hypothetical protein